jgi:CSLREA domain-containing protein
MKKKPFPRHRAPAVPLIYLFASALFVAPAHAAGDLVVNSAADHDDGACTVTDCTLREAIFEANDQTGPNTIRFAITDGSSFANGVYTIEVEEELPYLLDDGTTIDGFSQAVPNAIAGRPRVEITGGGMLPGTNGFVLFDSGNHVIRGLVINGFGGSGIAMVYPNANNNRVENCYIGVDATGTAAAPNGYAPFDVTNDLYLSDGVSIFYGAHDNVIGGVGKGNVLSGHFNGAGVYTTEGAYFNRIEGNLIGTDATGTRALSNGDGVLCVNDEGGNIIGGTASGAGNVISGNGDGVDFEDSPFNIVRGNRIGTNKDGTRALPNNTGVEIQADFTTVGGTANGAGNLISGNREDGIYAGEVFGLRVWGNKIGTDISGNRALPNGAVGDNVAGVYVDDAEEVYIGGEDEAMGNIISGNAGDGISVNFTFAFDGDVGALIANNFIGLNTAGTRAVGRQTNGIFVDFFSAAIGIVSNVISGNDTGARIEGEGVAIAANAIGTNASLNRAIPNGRGIVLDGAFGVFIGTQLEPGFSSSNLISGNSGNGIELRATDNVDISTNGIGIQGDGFGQLPNGGHGLALLGNTTRINVQENVIGYNRASGVWATKDVRRCTLRRNLIGRNGLLGIDLQKDSEAAGAVTLNDNLDRDSGANNLQNFPILADAVTTRPEANKTGVANTAIVRGTLNSAPNRRYRVEIYGNYDTDPSGYGEGQEFLQSLTVTTNAQGVANFAANLTLFGGLSTFTATATDLASGETSEFSRALPIRTVGGGFGGEGTTK